MKIRKCKVCGSDIFILGWQGHDEIVYRCANENCKNAINALPLKEWNAANKPDKPSKKDREIARLNELAEMYKADMMKAVEKIAELTKKVERLSSENVRLHNRLVAAVGVDEAFDG